MDEQPLHKHNLESRFSPGHAPKLRPRTYLTSTDVYWRPALSRPSRLLKARWIPGRVTSNFIKAEALVNVDFSLRKCTLFCMPSIYLTAFHFTEPTACCTAQELIRDCFKGYLSTPPKTRVNRPNPKPKNASASDTPTEPSKVGIALLPPLYAYCDQKKFSMRRMRRHYDT